MSRHFVIFNPASGRGRGRKRIEQYRGLLQAQLDDVTFATSSRPGEESDLAARAADEGYDVIVAVGGDGTWSNVADRLLKHERDDVALGLLPNGTGNDFGRSLGFDPMNAAEAVEVLARGHRRRVDVGRIDTLTASEHTPDHLEPRHFLNLTGFGFDVAVIDAAAQARFLKGELLYKITALQQLFSFPGVEVELAGPDGLHRSGRHLMLTVSNGRFFGGGFPIAPDATVEDGLLHACQIRDTAPFTRLKLFNMAERGRHVESEHVEVLNGSSFSVTFTEPPRFEVDGDIRRSPDRTVQMRPLPGVLEVVAPQA